MQGICSRKYKKIKKEVFFVITVAVVDKMMFILCVVDLRKQLCKIQRRPIIPQTQSCHIPFLLVQCGDDVCKTFQRRDQQSSKKKK